VKYTEQIFYQISSMEKIDFNQKLSENFTLSEFTDWAKNITMSDADVRFALRVCRSEFKAEQIEPYRHLARVMQLLRDAANRHFPHYNGNIRLRITSGFRPLVWEQRRGRNGSSQHTICAADFVPTWNGATRAQVNQVAAYIWSLLQNFEGGRARAFNGENISFIHLDFGDKRTWTY